MRKSGGLPLRRRPIAPGTKNWALYDARNGTLWLAVWGGYDVDTEGGYVGGSYVANAAREFRYDDPRARYMSRSIDVSASSREPSDPRLWTPIAPAAWTDYDGVMPYGDFDLDVDEGGNGAITEKARYADGFGTFGRQLLDAQGQVTETRYLHGDLIRSTNLTTGQGRTAVSAAACTAFGEIVGDDGQGRTRIGADPPAGFPRYQYAGGWGYEADLLTLGGAPTSPLPPVRLLHVGARWYQPDIGRFVQRDPIGIDGGANLYVYSDGAPLERVDPEGESSLLRPDAIVHLIEAEIAVNGSVAVNYGGNIVRVTAVIYQRGGRVATCVTNTGRQISFPLRGPKMPVTQTPSGGLIVAPPKGGVCGATGLEIAPLFLWLLWKRRRPGCWA